jgi:hypothetical protein
MKIAVFYIPLITSQRLFKEMKLKVNEESRASQIIRTVTNLNDDSSEGLAIKRLDTSEESSQQDSYRRLN